MIYHLIRRSDWEKARRDGIYRPESLRAEGFIHFSGSPEQVQRVANTYYSNLSDLLLLIVDPARLSGELKYEPPAAGGTVQGKSAGAAASSAQEMFPHLYAPLLPEAVIAEREYRPSPDGTFALPDLE